MKIIFSLTTLIAVLSSAFAQQVDVRGNLAMSARTAVDAVGSLAYTAGANNFAIVDMTNPAPVVRGQVTPGVTQITGIEVWGNYAYCAGQANGLVVINVTNPNSPAWIVNRNLAAAARDVAVYDTLVGVATAGNVTLLGVRTPSNPRILATYPRAASWIEFEPATRRLHVGSITGAFALQINTTVNGGDTTFALALYDQFDTQTLTPLAIGGTYVNAVRTNLMRVIHATTYDLIGQYTSSANIRAIASAPGYSFIGLSSGEVQYLSQAAANPLFLDGATVPAQVAGLALAQAGSQPLVAVAHGTGLAVLQYSSLAADPIDHPAIPQEIGMSAFPNPFNGTVSLTLTVPRSGDYHLTVFDNLGREIMNNRLFLSGSADHELDFTRHAAGHYVARLSGPSGNASLRLIYLP